MSAPTITPDHIDAEGDAEISDAAIEALARLLVEVAAIEEMENRS